MEAVNMCDNISDDIKELLEAVDVYNYYRLLDEVSIAIPCNRDDISKLKKTKPGKYTFPDACCLFICTSNEARRAKMETDSTGMNHGPRVKIHRGKIERTLAVPTKTLNANDSDVIKNLKAIKTFAENSPFPKEVTKAAVRFIFDNQMLIAAYWFASGNDELIRALTELAKQKLIDNNYAKNNVKVKSQEELDKDKKDLNEYIRSKLNDQSIELYFGKQKMSKEEKKANKKRK